MNTSRWNVLISHQLTSALLAVLAICSIVAGVDAAPRKVGVTLPLSGGLSPYGNAFRQGLQLFQEEHPEDSAKVTFLLDDSQYDGSKVVSSIRKLASVDKVDLLYVWGATPSEVAAPIAQQMRKPLLALTVDAVAKDRPYVAAMQLPLESLRVVLVEFLQKQQIKTTGVVGTNIGAAIRLIDAVRADLPDLAYEEIVPGDLRDFASVVTRIRQKPVDAIFLMLGPEQTVPFARQAAAQGLKTHLIGGDMLADDALRSELAILMGNVSYIYGTIDPEFRERYNARFKDTSHLYEAASGYSAGLLITQCATRFSDFGGTQFIASLAGETIVAPVGEISFKSSTSQGVYAELKATVYSHRISTLK